MVVCARTRPIGWAGNALRFFGVVFDITERRTAEGHLRQQWRTFDTALSHTPDFTYIFDLDGRFTYVNRAWLVWQKSYDEAWERPSSNSITCRILRNGTTGNPAGDRDKKEPVRDHTPYTGPDGVHWPLRVHLRPGARTGWSL